MALSCWHAALLRPAPPDPAVPLPIQLFRSCHRTWLWPRHGPCPAPPSLLSAPILSPVSTLVSPVPTFIFPSPALGGSSLQTSGQLRLFLAPEGEAKPPTPAPSPYRRMRKTQKKTKKPPVKAAERKRRSSGVDSTESGLCSQCEARPLPAIGCGRLLPALCKRGDAAVSPPGCRSRLAPGLGMGWRRSPVALLLALWLGQLGTWAAGRAKVNPRIIAAPQGECRAAPSGCGCSLRRLLPTWVSSFEQSRSIFISFVSSGSLLALHILS